MFIDPRIEYITVLSHLHRRVCDHGLMRRVATFRGRNSTGRRVKTFSRYRQRPHSRRNSSPMGTKSPRKVPIIVMEINIPFSLYVQQLDSFWTSCCSFHDSVWQARNFVLAVASMYLRLNLFRLN